MSDKLQVRREQAIDTFFIAAIWLWDKLARPFVDPSQRRELRAASDRMRAVRAARTEDYEPTPTAGKAETR